MFKKDMRFLSILLSVCFMCFLTACSMQATPSDRGGSPETGVGLTTAWTQTGESETPDPVSTAAPEKPKITLESAHCYEFSDGLAWVYNENTYYCINKNGEIEFQLSSGEYPATHFSKGTALIARQDGSDYVIDRLIDRHNRTVFSRSSLSVDGIWGSVETDSHTKAPRPYAHTMLADGYILVCRQSESVDGSKLAIGVLDTAGTWVSPLSEQHPIRKAGIGANTLSGLRQELYYKGGGMFAFGDSKRSVFYDVKANRCTEVKNTVMDGLLYQKAFRFEGESAVFTEKSTYAGYITKVTRDGRSSLVKEFSLSLSNPFPEESRPLSDGLVYGGFGYYDAAGNCAADLSSYDVKRAGNYYNGKTALVIRNDAGSHYLMVLDKKGERVFEPVKLPDDLRIGGMGSDFVWLWIGTTKGTANYVYDNQTGVLLNMFYGNISSLSEDVLIETSLYNGDGVYLNKYGQDLFS